MLSVAYVDAHGKLQKMEMIISALTVDAVWKKVIQMAKLPRDTITHFEYDGKGNINLKITELVRCKDCKWFNKPGCSIQIVDDSDKPSEDDYCSFAELRGDSDEN